jgi:hypothetical protein
MMATDCATLVTHQLPCTTSLHALLGKVRQSTRALGSFTNREIAREDVLQNNEMIGHGSRGHKLKCRIPPASNVKKKQEFA